MIAKFFWIEAIWFWIELLSKYFIIIIGNKFLDTSFYSAGNKYVLNWDITFDDIINWSSWWLHSYHDYMPPNRGKTSLLKYSSHCTWHISSMTEPVLHKLSKRVIMQTNTLMEICKDLKQNFAYRLCIITNAGAGVNSRGRHPGWAAKLRNINKMKKCSSLIQPRLMIIWLYAPGFLFLTEQSNLR